MTPPLLIGVAGASCSGKTTLARHLADHLATDGAVLSLDAYYRHRPDLTQDKRARLNFDTPEALDEELLLAHVAALAAGSGVDVPRYCFATHLRQTDTQRLEPSSVLVVEGLFALYWAALRQWYRVSVFVETADAVCLERRIARDVAERGRDQASVEAQYRKHARPMYERYVSPTRSYADLEVDGTAPLDAMMRRVQALL